MGSTGPTGIIGPTGNTGPAGSPDIEFGVYNPTITPVSGSVSFGVAAPAQFMRVGNVVNVSGISTLSTTGTGSGVVSANFTLPIPSIFSANYECAGTVHQTGDPTVNGTCTGDTGTGDMLMTLVVPLGPIYADLVYHYQYLIT